MRRVYNYESNHFLRMLKQTGLLPAFMRYCSHFPDLLEHDVIIMLDEIAEDREKEEAFIKLLISIREKTEYEAAGVPYPGDCKY